MVSCMNIELVIDSVITSSSRLDVMATCAGLDSEGRVGLFAAGSHVFGLADASSHGLVHTIRLFQAGGM